MPKFTRKPLEVEAVQWFRHGDHPAVQMRVDPDRPDEDGEPVIETLEGTLTVSPGDWIVTGVRGEHWPCKPWAFAQTYEPVRPFGGEDGPNVVALGDRRGAA